MAIANLTVNSTVSQSLGGYGDYRNGVDGRYYDFYRLSNLSPGLRVTVDLKSRSFDTVLYLYNAETGKIVGFDDNSGQGSNSRFGFTPTFGDQNSYYVIASSKAANSAGAYTVSAYQASLYA